VNPEALCYLNRLSDLLFVVARCLARHGGGQETLWQREPK
jgi:cob(I)alamin adenosyltransferase